ncbi:conserved unknown protein [Ectocarpus siliculosus]|uniref:Uncharacterized protein n=1 Tax=Ectocarpus siliculosus TaxID=2880 RepID=D8LHJ1_ECTSI|nr:conserved unknown protein [Ectocarpus siliculosus]|eukprot:CBN79273.1 conserved unknown protein [Ectocarpus siliculosus]
MEYTEMILEEFGVPAEFMSKDAVLACFSIGRTTASLVDVGGGTARKRHRFTTGEKQP